ncbi:MAG: hypothetical protein AB7N24_20010 [Dehalococcoidia bacterium]
MRTTVEIDDEKLIKLKKMAAERGEKGFSGLIDEALDALFAQSEGAPEADRRRIEAVKALEGSWGEEFAEEVRARIAESRKHWR